MNKKLPFQLEEYLKAIESFGGMTNEDVADFKKYSEIFRSEFYLGDTVESGNWTGDLLPCSGSLSDKEADEMTNDLALSRKSWRNG